MFGHAPCLHAYLSGESGESACLPACSLFPMFGPVPCLHVLVGCPACLHIVQPLGCLLFSRLNGCCL
mgnify:CR=1 FL=1